MTRRSAPAAAKRPYLSAPERRDDLLAAAARIVGRRGWSALTMVALAEAAGVSRQLVYEHFAGTSDLLVAVTHHLFERARTATARVLADRGEDPQDVVRRAYAVYLELPRAERRALRSLIDADPDAAEMRRARRLIRSEILSLWAPYVAERTGLPEAEARAATWLVLSGAWGLTDLVDEGSLSAERAQVLLGAAVEGLLGSLGAAAERPRRDAAGAAPPGRSAARKEHVER